MKRNSSSECGCWLSVFHSRTTAVDHRIGIVKVNEPSLWVEVIAPHRGEAFAACQFLIDEMKETVPIWKRPIPEGRAPLPSPDRSGSSP